jgi:hypothetical protein
LSKSPNSSKSILRPNSSPQAITDTNGSGADAEKLARKNDRARLSELLAAANAPKAKPGTADELRRFLDAHPHLTEKAELMTTVTEEAVLKRIVGVSPGSLELIRSELKGIRDRLGYEESPQMERLIIGEIVVAWVWVQWNDLQLAKAEKAPSIEFWQRQVSQAQKRFLRSCESLAKVRKLTERAVSPLAVAYLKGMAGRP